MMPILCLNVEAAADQIEPEMTIKLEWDIEYKGFVKSQWTSVQGGSQATLVFRQPRQSA
jgi:hypothetical protein